MTVDSLTADTGNIAITSGVLSTGGTQRLSNAGALSNITGYSQSSGNFDASGSAGTFSTSTGTNTLNGNTSISGANTFTTGTGTVALNGNTNVGSGVSLATQAGSTYTTAGSANNVAISTASLYRLDTSGAAQTITGIVAGRDGQLLTLVNADAALAVTLSNLSGSSSAANQISTGTGADITLAAGAAIDLIYDSTSSLWRVTGGVAGGAGTCAGCANTALSNLSSTNINAALNTTAGNLNLTTTTSGNINLNSAGTIELQDNTNVTGILAVTGNLTQSTGTFALSGNGASSLQTTSGALTLTSAAAATWSTSAGNLTIQAGSGTVSLGTSTALTAAGALTVSSGGAGALTLDSATNVLQLAASDTTIQRTAAGTTTIDLNDAANTTLAITNAGAGTASVTIDGNLAVNGGSLTSSAATLVINAAGNVDIQDSVTVDSLTVDTGNVTLASLGSADNATYLCRNSSNQVATCNTTGTGAAFVQGGNTFGATAVLGTNDANSLTFETNNLTQATIAVGGATTFQNSTNSAAAFQIQNATSGSLFNIDSTLGGGISLLGNNSAALRAWTTNASNLAATANDSVVVTANGYAYVIGGNYGGSVQDDYQYARINANGSVGSFTSVTNNQLPGVRWAAGGAAANGYVYVVGGSTNTTTTNGQSTVYYAKINTDGTLGRWQTNPNSICAAATGNAVIVQNGYIYSVGGMTTAGGYLGSTCFAKLNTDGTTGAWSTTNALPSAATRAWGGITTANGYLYFAGGVSTGITAQDDVYYGVQDRNTGAITWTTTGNLLPANRSAGSLGASNGYLFYIGGDNGTTPQDDVYYAQLNATGTTGAWAADANLLPANRGDMGSTTVVNNGYLYAFGGYDGSVGTNSIYYTSTPRVTVGGSLDLVGLSGENLTDGGGGSLTAGDTSIVGTLNVQEQANFWDAVNVAGPLLVSGNASFTNVGTLDAWTTNANALTGTRKLHSVAYGNGYVYVTGGRNNTGAVGDAQNTVYYAKVSSTGTIGAFSSTTVLPVNLSGHASTVVNGYLYVMGGKTSGASIVDTVYYARLNADGTVGTWKTTTSINVSGSQPRYFTNAVTNNGYVYLVGGRNGSETYQSTSYYAKVNADGTLGTWASTTAIPAIRSELSVTIGNGYIYATGGDDSGAQSTIYYAPLNADGTIGSWTTNGSSGAPSIHSHGSVITGGYLYLVGGNTGATAQTAVYAAKVNSNGSVGTWTTLTSSPLPAVTDDYSGTVFSMNGYLYVLGGSNTAGTPQSAVYYTSTNRVSIAGSLDLVGASGGNLADGSGGGSLTAGNTQIIGTLGVTANADFMQSVSVARDLNVGGTIYAGGKLATAATATISGGSLSNGPDGIAIQGRYAYVASYTESDIDVIDITNPNNPSVVSSTDLSTYGSSPEAIAVSGKYAYLLSVGPDILEIVDISSSTNPVLVKSIGNGQGNGITLSWPNALNVSGKYAYIVNYDSVEVIDISSSTNPLHSLLYMHHHHC